VTQFPEPDPGLDAQLDRLLESSSTPQTRGSVDFPRLAALLAAAAAPCEAGPQSGEALVLDAFRDLVVDAAGTPSLAARRNRRRMAVVAATSTVVMLGSGIAAAATGSLPGAAQSTAKTVLGVIGVSVPGPDDHAGNHPNQRGRSGDSHEPTAHPGNPAAPGASGAHPTPPAGVGTPPTPGNSGVSRHHGNPTPTATEHPTPGHGKPTAAPSVSRGRTAPARHTPTSLPVMQRYRPAISR
jgi:hypothetical protein